MRHIAVSLICLAVALPLAAQRTVAITFDDLPDINSDVHPVAIERAINAKLLAALKRNDLPAIGFVNEEQLEDDSVLQLWLAAGCELGNHTFAHSDFDAVTVEAAEDDILKGEAITRPLLASHNQPLVWFRHPFLDTGKTIDDRNAIDAFLTAHGYRVAPVTIDDSDWVYAYAYEKAPPLVRPIIRNSYVRYLDRRFRFAEELSRRVFGREIAQVLLLHDSALNADAFDEVAAMMRQRGYRGVTLDEALRDPAYATREEWAGGGVGWLERWGVARGIPTSVFEADPPVPRWIQFLAGPPS
jgi:peptidoglycan/xylan/chitin deacetylase (PgdA/CDA1 family)